MSLTGSTASMSSRQAAAVTARGGWRGVVQSAVLFAAVVVLVFASAGVTPRHAGAQSADDGASYLTPFPAGETYRLLVVGDNLAEGIHGALLESLGSDPRLEIDRKMRWLSGVSRPDHVEETKGVTQVIATEKKNIVVVLLASQDRWSLRGADGRRYAVGSREWRDEYGKRLGEMMRTFKANGAAVYWVGLPIMRRPEVNEAAQAINEVMRERAYLNGIKFIDIYAGFADENGEFSPYGPDLAGTPTRLRERDGILMTDAGYAKLAHFVEREVKRDLAQAKNERSIPLAGSEEEQSRINPGARLQGRTTAAAAATALTGNGKTAPAAQVPAAGGGDGSGEQKADNSRVSIKTASADGREEAFTVEIVRPAIPQAVLALVTRRESTEKASQMGDAVVDQIPGGLTVMSSITPVGDGGGGSGTRRKVSPTQAPYFRVLVKGERIAPRAGRADDMTWPRPEPPAPKRAEVQEVDPATAATAADAAPAPDVATGSLPAGKKRQRRQ